MDSECSKYTSYKISGNSIDDSSSLCRCDYTLVPEGRGTASLTNGVGKRLDVRLDTIKIRIRRIEL